ncbi:hypothetical protein T484DRAFT_1780470, partial [Baffinella frigidus]
MARGDSERAGGGPKWREATANALIVAMDQGEREMFWSLWERYIPPTVRAGDMETRGLELEVHVHFAVFAVLPLKAKVGGGKVEPGSVEMRALKAFIEGPGNALLQRGQ